MNRPITASEVTSAGATSVGDARTRPDPWIGAVLLLAIVVPCVGGALDSKVAGIAAAIYEGASLLLVASLLWQARGKPTQKRVVGFLRSGINAPVSLWLLVVLGSWAFGAFAAGARPYSTQEMLRQASGIALYFVVTNRFRRSEQLMLLAQTLLLVGVGVAAMGCLQYSWYDGGLATGPYHDHQLCGSCLAILLPIAAAIVFGTRETNRQLIAQTAAALIGIGLLLTFTRSAWVGAMVGLFALAAVTLFPSVRDMMRRYGVAGARPERAFDHAGIAFGVEHRVTGIGDLGGRKHELAFPLMVVVAVIGFVSLLAYRGSVVTERVGTFASLASDQSWNRRMQAWHGAVKMIAEHPLYGVGIGQYPVVQRNYTGLSVGIDRNGGRPTLAEQAHNVYLQMTAEVGTIGMVVFASVPLSFLFASVRRLRDMSGSVRKYLLQGAVGAVVVFVVDAFGNPSWQCGQVSILFWLVLGLGASCLRPGRPGRVAGGDDAPARPSSVGRCAALLVVLALCLVPTATLAVSGASPDHIEIEPKRIALPAGRVELHLYLVNTDGSRRDVTGSAETQFVQDHQGQILLRRVGGRFYYEPCRDKHDAVSITGIFSGAKPDVTAPKDRATCVVARHAEGL